MSRKFRMLNFLKITTKLEKCTMTFNYICVQGLLTYFFSIHLYLYLQVERYTYLSFSLYSKLSLN
jgi:hypothetical protein